MRYFIHLNYNGSQFKGWQKQPGELTIQSALEEALSIIMQSIIEVTGCGRTDAGVHAASFYAHFDGPQNLPEKCCLRLNKLLPKDIGVFDIKLMKEEAHSRFDATSRTYQYFIHFNKDAFLQERSFWIHSYTFDIEKMNEAANVLLNYNNFTTFEKKGSDNKTSICDISEAHWTILNNNQWCFTITADRFLRNMVRRIVGTLLMIGINRLSLKDMQAALNKHDVLEVNIAPPAHGLFLSNITYPSNIKIEQ